MAGWVTSEGLFVGQVPGSARLTVQLQDTVLVRDIDLIPPVTSITWEPAVERALVGDTIRLRAVARGPSGEVAAILPASSATGGYSHIIWGGDAGTIVVPNTPGTIVLTATAGRHSSKIQIIVENP
jgi:hypothetical protein